MIIRIGPIRKPEIVMARPEPNPKELEVARMIRRSVGTEYHLSSRHGAGTGGLLYRNGYITSECHRFRVVYRYTGKPVEEEYLVDENGDHLRDLEEWTMFYYDKLLRMDKLLRNYVDNHFYLDRRIWMKPEQEMGTSNPIDE